MFFFEISPPIILSEASLSRKSLESSASLLKTETQEFCHYHISRKVPPSSVPLLPFLLLSSTEPNFRIYHGDYGFYLHCISLFISQRALE